MSLEAKSITSADAVVADFMREYFRGTEGRTYLGAIRNPNSKLGSGEFDKLVTRKISAIAEFVSKHDDPKQDCAIYFCTATLKNGATNRVSLSCWQFISLFADCDDKNHDLTRAEAIDRLEACECPPTFIVDSGHGLQPHWLFSEAAEDAKRVIAARKKLQARLSSDKVHDAARFMRLPGSHNSKEGDWLPVEIVSRHPERRYALEVLEDWLDRAKVVIPSKIKAPANGNGAAKEPFVLPPSIKTDNASLDHRRGAAWARKALEESASELAHAGEGSRHNTLLAKSIRMGTMIARRWIDENEVKRALLAASEACGQMQQYGIGHFNQTFADGLKHGLALPHPDLPNDEHTQQTPAPKPLPSGGAGDETEKPKIRQAPRSWWRDPATIPPRQSLYDGHYIRRAIGATIGAGGRAKTTRGIFEAVSMAVGFDIATKDALPDCQLRVWICNGEEDQDELDRRVAATCQHYGIVREDLGGRLFVQSVRDNPLRIATLVHNRPVIDQAVLKFMTDFVRDNSIDVFMLDPLVSFHGVMENDNGHMDLVIKEGFGSIANSTNSAGEMFHHPGKAKPGQPDTSVEDGRGASAILWAVRSARVFNFMTPDEAAKLGMTEDDRKLYIRIANGKANMGPLGKAKWMKLVIENLVNGDHVACSSPWSPPDPFKGVTTTDMELARTLARTGEYRADMRSPHWFGYALANHFGLSLSHQGENDPKDLARIKTILKTWLKNKVLEIDKREDDKRKVREFIIPGSFKTAATSIPVVGYLDDE